MELLGEEYHLILLYPYRCAVEDQVSYNEINPFKVLFGNCQVSDSLLVCVHHAEKSPKKKFRKDWKVADR